MSLLFARRPGPHTCLKFARARGPTDSMLEATRVVRLLDGRTAWPTPILFDPGSPDSSIKRPGTLPGGTAARLPPARFRCRSPGGRVAGIEEDRAGMRRQIDPSRKLTRNAAHISGKQYRYGPTFVRVDVHVAELEV